MKTSKPILEKVGDRPTQEYLCEYFHDGSWWTVMIHAYDSADADARVRKLGNLHLRGEVMATIPASLPGAVRIARLICWFRNFFRGF